MDDLMLELLTEPEVMMKRMYAAIPYGAEEDEHGTDLSDSLED